MTIFANYEGYVSQSNVSNETTSHLAIQLLLCFPKPVLSSPSILDNHTVSTRRCIGYVGASESTSLVLVSIFVPQGATNTCVRVLLDQVPENIQKWFLIYEGMPYRWTNALCPAKQPTSPMLVHSQVGVRTMVEVLPEKHVRKTLASILS